jgi:c-di-GMP-related signal transduction protein
LHEVLEKIQLSKAMQDALLSREGYLGKFLSLTEKLEKTDQLQIMIEHLAPKINLSPEQLYALYCRANEFGLKDA